MRHVFSKWTRDNFDRIDNLNIVVIPLFREFLLRIAMAGIYVRIPNDGHLRTSQEQAKLYYKNPPSTWVLCPYSFHCHGLAIDLVPLQRLNTLLYRALWGRSAWERKQYETMGKIAMQLDITWGYAVWGVDMGHFHCDGGMGLKTPSGTMPEAPKVILSKKSIVVRRVMVRLGLVEHI